MNAPDFSRTAAAQLLRELAIFCLCHGGKLYRGWTGKKLFEYLAFQLLTGGLVFYAPEGEVLGILVAWRDSKDEILRREAAAEPHFNWQVPARNGDSFMVADVIARDGDSIFRLLQMASARWPDWKMRRVFTHRRGRLVELPRAHIERWLRGFTPGHT